MFGKMTFLSQWWAMFLFWSTCLSIRETEIIGENGEQHAVGKETSSLHHKDHVGKLLIIQVPGTRVNKFRKRTLTKMWKCVNDRFLKEDLILAMSRKQLQVQTNL